MPTKVPLYTLPAPSTNLLVEPAFCGRRIELKWGKSENTTDVAVEFSAVKATMVRSEPACTAWHIDGAYDQLVEIVPSAWAAAVHLETSDVQRRQGVIWPLRHFMIYLDTLGCVEMLADNWRITQ